MADGIQTSYGTQIAEALSPDAEVAHAAAQLFIVAKDEAGFRAVVAVPDQHSDEARTVEAAFEDRGFEVTGIVGFDLEDAMRSCPSYFHSGNRGG